MVLFSVKDEPLGSRTYLAPPLPQTHTHNPLYPINILFRTWKVKLQEARTYHGVNFTNLHQPKRFVAPDSTHRTPKFRNLGKTRITTAHLTMPP